MVKLNLECYELNIVYIKRAAYEEEFIGAVSVVAGIKDLYLALIGYKVLDKDPITPS